MRAPPVAEKQTSGMRSFERALGRAREFLADDRAHRAAHVGELERDRDQRMRLQRAAHRDQRIFLAGLLSAQRRCGPCISSNRGTSADRPAPAPRTFPRALPSSSNACRRLRARDRVVMAALRAHFEVALELGPVQHRAAAVAFFPQAFRHLALGVVAFGAHARRHQFLQPAHVVVFSVFRCGVAASARTGSIGASLRRLVGSRGMRAARASSAARIGARNSRADRAAVSLRPRPLAQASRCSTSALPITTASANLGDRRGGCRVAHAETDRDRRLRRAP